MNEVQIDEVAYETLIQRLAANAVDSICALGSTGNYMYLSRAERAKTHASLRQSRGAKPN